MAAWVRAGVDHHVGAVLVGRADLLVGAAVGQVGRVLFGATGFVGAGFGFLRREGVVVKV